MMDLKLYKRPVAALTITGERIRVTPGLLSKFADAFSDAGINIFCISMGEYSLSFYVEESEHFRAQAALTRVIEGHAPFASVSLMKNLGMITATGKEFVDRPGTFVELFEPVSRSGINIYSISTSFDSAIMFVEWGDARRAYDAVERRFGKGA
jgi:aspartokinase